MYHWLEFTYLQQSFPCVKMSSPETCKAQVLWIVLLTSSKSKKKQNQHQIDASLYCQQSSRCQPLNSLQSQAKTQLYQQFETLQWHSIARKIGGLEETCNSKATGEHLQNLVVHQSYLKQVKPCGNTNSAMLVFNKVNTTIAPLRNRVVSFHSCLHMSIYSCLKLATNKNFKKKKRSNLLGFVERPLWKTHRLQK